MKCRILYDAHGRLRVHLAQNEMSCSQADILEAYLKRQAGVVSVKVFQRNADAAIQYNGRRSDLIHALAVFSYEKNEGLAPEHSSRQLSMEYENKLADVILGRAVRRFFLPFPIRYAFALWNTGRYIVRAIRSLKHKRLEVPVLDAVAITVSMVRGDAETATSVMFLLHIGDILEEWTHKKSVADLAGAMSLGVDRVWVRSEDGPDVQMSVHDVKVGSEVIIGTGGMIPLDGFVTEGEASVNQSAMTGESQPVLKKAGSYVYAGTVLEEGRLVIRVEKEAGSGRYDSIVHMIEDSEKLKSSTEDKASHLADRLVPYSLGGTLLTWLLTRNASKALSILMVDFSCALKLSMPLAVLSAMREASGYDISVKGGKFLEAVANAHTIVFDKTGTLTHAQPRVAEVIAFGGTDEDEALRLAACLEEHYPHSMAKAVVAEAKKRNLNHEERHTEVQYVVAHGIASTVNHEKVVIGSYHFVFQDEGCTVPEDETDKFHSLPDQYSHLFLAVAGRLIAVICVEDPLREEAPEVLLALRKAGFDKLVMMTGDNAKTAEAVARRVGVDEVYSEVLPEDKAEFIRREHAAGRTVMMVGDGVNDSPALSEADVGISISDGAAIAREISDISLTSDDLYSIVTLRKISDALMKRIHFNYRFIMSFNSMLIILGVAGFIAPSTSALLHNLSTIAISLKSTTKLLEEKKEFRSEPSAAEAVTV